MVLHPRAAEQVAQFIAAPSHATLLIGAHGMGKTHLAQHMTAQVLGLQADALEQHPYYLLVQPNGSSISIDAIRELQRFLQLKTLGNERQLRRAIIIEHADTLTTEAQNAFLKLLEEPPADTLMILTVNSKRALLPTILSRAQALSLPVPHEADVKAHFGAMTDDTTLAQAYFLSGGLPGLMHALVSGDETHPLMQGVATAKTILQKQAFERLALVESLSKNKEQAGFALDALLHIAQTGINGAAAKADTAKLKQWHRILKATQAARDALLVNANPKLTLTNLMLQL
jgi:DNA polymerase-3 subunit delta'